MQKPEISTTKEFWTLGLIFGAIYLAVLLLVGRALPPLLFELGAWLIQKTELARLTRGFRS